jgi:hypothetical protein
VELIPSIELGLRPYRGRRLPLPQISVGANDRIRTDTSRLGRPVGNRYPTFAFWFGLRVSNPSLHDGAVGCCLHTQAEHGPVSFTGLSTSFSCQRPRSFRTDWWAARDSNPSAPVGRTVLQAVGGPSAPYCPMCGDSARI